MQLRTRVQLIICVTLGLLLSSLYVLVDRFVLSEFRALEFKEMEQHVIRVEHAFETTKEQLISKVVDWAQWDDTYEFISNQSEKYTHENLNFLTLEALKFKHLLYFDKEGKLQRGLEIFSRRELVDDIPIESQQTLIQAPLARSGSDNPTTGLIRLNESVVLFATSPILDSKRQMESRGTLMGTIDVNPAMLRNIASQTNLSVSIFRLGIDQLGMPEEIALNSLTTSKSAYITDTGKELMQGYGLLRDYNGRPALLYRVDSARSIYQQALNVLKFMFIALVCAGILWLFMTWWLLSRWIVAPLLGLSEQARKIAAGYAGKMRVGGTHKQLPLKTRAAIIVSLTMALMSIGIIVLFSNLLAGEFDKVEQVEISQHVERALRALSERQNDLQAKAIDWGQWDDTYQFVVDHNDGYIDSILNFETLGSLGVSHVLYFDVNKKLVAGNLVDNEKEKLFSATELDSSLTEPFGALIPEVPEPRSGYVQVGKSIYMVASSPILDTSREQQARGTFMFAIQMDAELAKDLSQQTQLKVSFSREPTAHARIANSSSEQTPIEIEFKGGSEVVGMTSLHNSEGATISTLQVTTPRDVHVQGKQARLFLAVWLVVITLIFVIVTMVALQRWALSKIAALSQSLFSEKGSDGELNFSENGKDNATSLSNKSTSKDRDGEPGPSSGRAKYLAKLTSELRVPAIRTRVQFIICATLILLLGTLYFLIDHLVLSEFRSLEANEMQQNVLRVERAFDTSKDQLVSKIVDWGQWDDTYEFVQHESPEYIHETLNFFALDTLKFKHLLYFDVNAKLLHGYEVFPRQELLGPIPPSTLAMLQETPHALTAKDAPISGLMALDEALVLFAATPILDSKHGLPSRGTLLGTIDINPATLTEIAAQTNLKLTAFRLGIDQLGIPEERALKDLKTLNKSYILEARSEIIHGYGVLRDHKGRPVLLYRVDSTRAIYHQALNVLEYMVVALLCAGLLWLTMTWWLLSKWIVAPLLALNTYAKSLIDGSEANQRTGTFLRKLSFQKRTVAIVAITTTLLSIAITIPLSNTLTNSFIRVERSEIGQHVERALRAVSERKQELLSRAIDWGQWDDTYDFVFDLNDNYPASVFPFEALSVLGLSHVLVFDSQNKLVAGRLVNLKQKTLTDALQIEKAQLDPFVSLIPPQAMPSTGFIKVGSSSFLVASSPILDTLRSKPARGTFMFAIEMDKQFAESLSKQTQLNLGLLPPSTLESESKITTDSNKVVSLYFDEPNELKAKVGLYDGSNHMVSTLQLRMPREVYAQGEYARLLLTGWVVAVNAIFILVTFLALYRWAISKIGAFSRAIFSDDSDAQVEPKFDTDQQDEVERLASNINTMLAALEKTQNELTIAKNAAEAANQAKSLFIAKVSHELRTPIGSITGINGMIMKRENSRAIRELVKMSDQAAWGLLDIINEILDFSKAESGNITIESIPFDIRQLVRETMQVISGKIADQSKIELVADVDPNVAPTLVGDPTKLRQILVNLLSNAVKFTKEGEVGMSIETTGFDLSKATIAIKVWDSGIGIPEDKLATIFEPFKQVDETVTRQYQGTGLGLAIVKQFSEALGGTVSVESKAGQGSTFTLTLPCGVEGASEYTLQNTDLNAPWPLAMVVAGSSTAMNVAVKNLNKFGVMTERINADSRIEIEANLNRISAADLLVITEAALANPILYEAVEARLKAQNGHTIAVINPANLDLSEKLYSLNIQNVLPGPVLAEDLILAYLKKLPEAHARSNGNGKVHTASRKGLRILVADDTNTNRIVMQDMLEEFGHEVITVGDGSEILKLISPMLNGESGHQHFDIVLTDVSMPVMDGVTATRKIRELEDQIGQKTRIPIVAITAHALDTEAEEMKAAGIDGIVTKPVRADAVAAELERVMGDSN